MLISRYVSRKSNRPTAVKLSWQDLKSLLSVHTLTDCAPCKGTDCPRKDGPAWSPAELMPGTTRANKNVVRIWAAVFDCDDLNREEVQRLADKLDSSGYAYVAHTTHSSTAESLCLRVVTPVSRPVAAQEWREVLKRAIAHLEIPADPACKDLSRLYYLPSAPKGSNPFVVHAEGKALDVDGLLAHPEPLPSSGSHSAVPVDISGVRAELKRYCGDNAELIKRVLAGEPLADDGERDTSIQKLMSTLAFKFPEVDDDILIALVRQSLETMPGDEPEKGWLKEAEDKLTRARVRHLEAKKSEQALKDAVAKLARQRAGNEDPESAYYTEEEVRQWAELQGCSFEEFTTRWVVQFGGKYWILREGTYREGLPREAAENAVHRDLAPAKDFVSLTRPTAKAERPAKLNEIVQANGTVVDGLSYTLVDGVSKVQGDVFYITKAKLRPFAPAYHAEVDHWLDLLGGTEKERLKDWLAGATNLARATCALYFMGAPKVGKSLLAEGVSRLWAEAPTRLTAEKLTGWNETFLKCPLLFVDETIVGGRHGDDASSLIRDLITSTTHDLRRKFLDGAQIKGAFRVIFAANNPRLLRFSEQMTAADIDALESRFLLIHPEPSAAPYLKALGNEVTKEWMERLIPEHVLHLVETRKVVHGERLLVEGASGALREVLATSAGVAPAVCEWIVKALLDPKAVPAQWKPYLRAGNGEVWINTSVVADDTAWHVFVGSSRVPTLREAAQALGGMSMAGPQPKRRVGKDKQIRFHRLSGEMLLRQAEEFQLYDDSLRDVIYAKVEDLTLVS